MPLYKIIGKYMMYRFVNFLFIMSSVSINLIDTNVNNNKKRLAF